METIKRIAVYSTAQRITHGLIAIGVMFELASAWLIQHSDVDIERWSDWHSMVGQLLILLFVYRIFLMFRNDSGHWRFLIPSREQRFVLLDTVKFYASLGRLKSPDWFSLNPLWQPLYLLVIVLVGLTAISGYLIGNAIFIGGYPLQQWHGWMASSLLYFLIAHIVVMIAHDSKSESGIISAMINGHKYFKVKNANSEDLPQSNAVSLNDLLNSKPDSSGPAK